MPQWNLRTLLLLTAAVAVWVAYLHFRYEIPRIEREIAPLRHIGGTLIVRDPRQIAVVRTDEEWYDEEGLEVYLPEGAYALRVATREIRHEGIAPTVKEAAIPPGRHRIAFRKSSVNNVLQFTVLVDGQKVLEVKESTTRDFGRGYLESVLFEGCEQLPPDEPVVLYRGRFGQIRESGAHYYSVSHTDAPTNGLLLWIEQVAPAGDG